jgi:hypothetical protein
MKMFKRRLKVSYYAKRWQTLQSDCASRRTWPNAVKEADKLLDRALKKRGYKGKTTGERLVAAQHDISFNEAVWFSHKYSQKLADVTDVRTLKKKDVITALAGFRHALKDIGALENSNGQS